MNKHNRISLFVNGVDGEGWSNITSAPRDGTPIEIKNDYGVMPSYSLCHWVHGEGWKYVNDECRGVVDGDHLSWRPYAGDPAAYVDPTNGAQKTRDYWLRGCAR